MDNSWSPPRVTVTVEDERSGHEKTSCRFQLRTVYEVDDVPECPLFSPKQPFRHTHLDSVSMSAFGHKQSFKFYAYACILTVNERLLSAISGHWLTVNATSKLPHPGANSAYLEDVTSAEFCEEGGHGTLRIIPKAVEQCSKLGPLKLGIAPGIRGE